MRETKGQNNGSKNKFYALPNWVNDCDTLSEYLELNPDEFNVLKTLWLHKGKRHEGTNEEREINKRVHYSIRSLIKLKRDTKGNICKNVVKKLLINIYKNFVK